MTISARKLIGPVVVAALVLGVATRAALADCSETDIKGDSHKATVDVKNNSSKPFVVDIYMKGVDDENYGPPVTSATLGPDESKKEQYDTPRKKGTYEKNIVYVKVLLSGITTDAGGTITEGQVADCNYYTMNYDKNDRTQWGWADSSNKSCVTEALSEYCEDCKIACEKKFGDSKWATTFTITE